MKNANRSDNQKAMARQNRSGHRGRRVGFNGLSKERDGKFLFRTPHEIQADRASRLETRRCEVETERIVIEIVKTKEFWYAQACVQLHGSGWKRTEVCPSRDRGRAISYALTEAALAFEKGQLP